MTREHADNAMVSLTYVGPKARTQPADTFAADVLSQLVAHKGGRFYRKFVDSGLAYQAGISYYTQSQAGEIQFAAITDPAKAQKVAKMLETEISAWAKPGYFTKEQLEDVRRNLAIHHKREVNQPSEYAKNMAFWWAVTGLDYYDQYQSNLKKVSLEQVQAFVRTWLLNKPHVTAILMSPENAQKAHVADTAKPLVDKYLTMYRQEGTKASESPATNDANKK
jgi:zinc protease